MVYFHDWPDVTIHTNKDLPENLDATKLGRVAYMAAGIAWTLAALPPEEAPRLVGWALAGQEANVARARFRPESSPRDAALSRRESLERAAATLDSIAALWPSAAEVVRAEKARLRALVPEVPPAGGGDPRVPARSAEIVGPLGIYYSDYLAETLGAEVASKAALPDRADGVLAYEAFNLADGRRTVSQIRDILTGRYAPVPLAEVAAYFDLLARAKAITWK